MGRNSRHSTFRPSLVRMKSVGTYSSMVPEQALTSMMDLAEVATLRKIFCSILVESQVTTDLSIAGTGRCMLPR